MKDGLVKFLKARRFRGMRRGLLIFGVISTVFSGAVFLVQAMLETRSFYRQLCTNAWEMVSFKLAEWNTTGLPPYGQRQYHLVTGDFGDVLIDLELTPDSDRTRSAVRRLNSDTRLKTNTCNRYLAYNGLVEEEGQKLYRSVFLLFTSGENQLYHLHPEGQLAGYFSLTQPITAAKTNLLLSHGTKIFLWIGFSAVVWMLLMAVGSKLVVEMETASQQLVEDKRDSIISKVVSTFNHQINSPLLGIFGSIDLLSANENDPRKIKLINSLGAAAGKIKEVTTEMGTSDRYRLVPYPGGGEIIQTDDKRRTGELV